MNSLMPEGLLDSALLKKEAVTATLRELVHINSVNPAHGGPPGGERKVMEWAAGFLCEHGIEVEIKNAATATPLLRARIEGTAPGPPLMFETHVDTVSVEGMTIEPFGGKVRDGKLWGRGATDAKGQAAAMLHAFAAWAQAAKRGAAPPQSAELVLVTDEEYNFGGVNALLRDGVQARGIVIGEPTQLRIVTTHKGTVRWWVRCEGRAAHGAKPHLGVNAISVAAKMIEAIERELVPKLSTRSAPLLGSPTVNIGRIEGGIQVNLVPPLCRFQIDRRIIPGENEPAARAELDEILQRAAVQIPGCRVEVEKPSLAAGPLASDAGSELVRVAGEASAACGGKRETMGVDYATDASVLALTGLPIIVAGPGNIDQAHTADEYIEIEALAAGARFYAMLMGQLISLR